jgi:fructokinase
MSPEALDARFLCAMAPPLLAIVPSIEPPDYFFSGEGAADLKFDPAKLPVALSLLDIW